MVNLADLPNAAALAGTETLPMQQGAGAVKVTVNFLLSRAAGQVLPFEIGGQRIVTINGTGPGVAELEVGSGVRATGPSIRLTNTYNGSDWVAGDVIGEMSFAVADSSLPGVRARVRAVSEGGTTHPSQVALAFSTFAAGAEKEGMRLTGAGDGSLLVGKTASALAVPGVELAQSGLIRATRNDFGIEVNRLNTDGAAVLFRRGGASVGTISVTASSTAYNTSSDYRLPWKAGHVPLTGSGEFIDSLNPRYFPLVGHGGFVAHEFQEVSPSSVTGDKDAVDEDGTPIYQQMDASSPDVMANIIAELQSLRQRVAALEAAT